MLVRRIAAAMIAPSQALGEFDYVIFDSDLVLQYGMVFEYERGNTPDKGLNEHHHINLKHISAQRLTKLADHLLRKDGGIVFDRENPKSVGEYILESLSRGWLVPEKIPEAVRKALDKYFPHWRDTTSTKAR